MIDAPYWYAPLKSKIHPNRPAVMLRLEAVCCYLTCEGRINKSNVKYNMEDQPEAPNLDVQN